MAKDLILKKGCLTLMSRRARSMQHRYRKGTQERYRYQKPKRVQIKKKSQIINQGAMLSLTLATKCNKSL